jgi:hypothetical protein
VIVASLWQETHEHARNDLTRRLANAHRDRETGVCEVEEGMQFRLAEQEAEAAQREAELEQQLRQFKEQAKEAAMKTVRCALTPSPASCPLPNKSVVCHSLVLTHTCHPLCHSGIANGCRPKETQGD